MDATDSWTRLDTVPPEATSRTARGRAAVSRLIPGRVPRPAVQGLLAFLIYLAVFVSVYARPLVKHMNTPDLRQFWTDPNFYTWSMQWWPYALTHGVNPLFSTQVGAPKGYELAWASTTPAVAIVMWPVTALFGVLVSYNIVLLLVPPVSAWAAFVAARRLTGRFWASLLAGSVYGFCSYELVHNWQGQPNLTVIAVFPLMVYLVLRWWDGTLGRIWFVLLMAAAMAVEFYVFTEAFFDMTAVLAGTLVIGFAVAGRTHWVKAAWLAVLTAIAYAAAIAASGPYLYYALKHEQTGAFLREKDEYSLRLARLILPWSDRVFGVSSLVSYSNYLGRSDIDDYVSLPLILVLIGVAVFAWRSRVARIVVLGFVFVIALALGPDLEIGKTVYARLPWSGLWSLPIARSAEPARLVVFAVLALAIALALWLAVPVRSKLLAAGRWGLGLLAVAAVLWATPTAHLAVNPLADNWKPPAGEHPANQLPPFITDGMYRQYLRPGEIVVIVTHRGNAGMLFQADAGFYFRIAGGFINASLTKNALPHPVSLVAHPSKNADRMFEDWVRSSGLGAVIVEQAWEEPWMHNFATKLHMQGTSVGGVTIYPIAPWLASQAHAAAAQHAPHAQKTHQAQKTQQA